MVIIDTDILVKALRQETEALDEVSELLENKAAAVTPAQISEIYTLTRPDETPIVSQFLKLFTVMDFTTEVAALAGEFMQQYQEFYPELTTLDCLVGAACVVNDCQIYTLQPKHFPMTEVRLYHKTIKAITAKSKTRLADRDIG